jgi:hypothetical protein
MRAVSEDRKRRVMFTVLGAHLKRALRTQNMMRDGGLVER